MDLNHLSPPALPPPDDCLDVMAAFRRGEDGGDGNNFRIADRLELHMPRDAPFVRGAFGAAVVNVWGERRKGDFARAVMSPPVPLTRPKQ